MTPAQNELDKKPLTEIYNDSAALYQKTFPEKLANLFITLGFDQIYVAPDIADLLTQNVSTVREMINDRLARMQQQKITAGVGVSGVDGRDVRYLSLTGNPNQSFVSARHPPAMNQISVFDHEMGHIIVRNGTRGKPAHLSECVADAYAALRHVQRFGGGTDIFDHAPGESAAAAIFEPFPIHYTSAIFQKIGRVQKEGKTDIAALSLPDTAELAAKIAVDYALSDTMLEKIHNAYAFTRDAAAEEFIDWPYIVKCVAGDMLAHKNDDNVYRAGKLYLERTDIKRVIAAKLTDDRAFQRDLAVMAQHEKDSGFILDASLAIDKRRADTKSAFNAVRKPAP